VSEIPASSNFFAVVTGEEASVDDVAALYRAAGWQVRKCGNTDYEARSDVAELVIEGVATILVHGPVAEPVANAAIVTKPLRDAAIGFFYECYGADRALLLEEKWTPAK